MQTFPSAFDRIVDAAVLAATAAVVENERDNRRPAASFLLDQSVKDLPQSIFRFNDSPLRRHACGQVVGVR